jgi:ribosomal protein L24
LVVSLQSILNPNSISRDLRFVIRKAGKALDALIVRTAEQTQKLAIQGVRLEQLEQKKQEKQKKAAVNSNEAFADIEKIKRAQVEVARQSAA